MNKKTEIFSEKIQAGSRNYFFDVRVSSDGVKYLTISESKRKEGENFDHDRIMIFEEHIETFREGLSKAFDFILNSEK